MRKLIELFWEFFKVGAFTFGGGYAMLPIIEDACVDKKKWITHDDMMTVIVIAESTPGPVSVNCATFVGYQVGGVLGAIIATLGLITPAFLIIYLISQFLDNLLEIKLVAYAFKGIKIAVGFLIWQAGVRMIKKMEKDTFSKIVVVCATILMLLVDIFSWNFSSITMMLIAAVISLVVFMVRDKRRAKGGEDK